MGIVKGSDAGVRIVLYPPYSTIAGRKEVFLEVSDRATVLEVFKRLVQEYPALSQHFFPGGSEYDFPGYASILRSGKPLKAEDVLKYDDVIEVIAALTGG
ncbi:MAG: MoaD/ThiS family protein [Candidatus Fermentithermobacillus carboniphilus]|uniref:MoaD/ThiS family protein n=1 Tax=Candidatus Fermentithermobacillus carboniphilus TaxID=3085328 RepID=A0AAT9LF71_9FIRM|nr:MAG: MoaD/ThiS family protein [Candidatus Fermentithermobacillus carboniphilus]